MGWVLGWVCVGVFDWVLGGRVGVGGSVGCSSIVCWEVGRVLGWLLGVVVGGWVVFCFFVFFNL